MHIFWNFLILFSLIWILLYSLVPSFVMVDEQLDKISCLWYASIISIFIALGLVVMYVIFSYSEERMILRQASKYIEKVMK